MSDLSARIEAELATPAPPAVVELAAALADPAVDAAILYYGSTLRTGDLSGVLDFYRLTKRPHRRGLHGLVERVLWPEVSYHEVDTAAGRLRAKVATLPLATFRAAAEGRTLDTTIWARFVQPCQRVWSADAPTGPFEPSDPVAKIPSDFNSNLYLYMPLAHPELFPQPGSLVVSVSRNTDSLAKIEENPTLYRPEFMTITLPS